LDSLSASDPHPYWNIKDGADLNARQMKFFTWMHPYGTHRADTRYLYYLEIQDAIKRRKN